MAKLPVAPHPLPQLTTTELAGYVTDLQLGSVCAMGIPWTKLLERPAGVWLLGGYSQAGRCGFDSGRDTTHNADNWPALNTYLGASKRMCVHSLVTDTIDE